MGNFSKYYANQRRIVDSDIAEIFSVKSMKSDTSCEIKRIAREIFKPIASLNSLNRAASLGSDLIVHFTLNRLDLNTRREWVRYLGDSVVPPTMEQLQAFLRSQILTLEVIEACTRSSSNSNPKTQSPNSKSRKSEQDVLTLVVLILFVLIKLHLRPHQKRNVRFVMNLILQINVNDFSIKRFL